MSIRFGIMNGFATREEAVAFAKRLIPPLTIMELCETNHEDPFGFSGKVLGYYLVQGEVREVKSDSPTG